MKVLSKLFVVLAVITAANLVFATIVDDVLLVPMADEAPVIDGVIDPIWYSTTAIPMRQLEDGGTMPDGYLDKHTMFRAMWDEDALYVLVECVDDSILAPANLDPWNRDCVELFIDEDNSKNDQATGYDANDHQWRYVVDAVYEEGVTAEPGPFAFGITDSLYVFEISIPQESIPDLVLEEGSEFGFDVSSADTDNDKYRSAVMHWWATSGYAWNTPAVFGDAELVDSYVAASVLGVKYTEDSPVIDGVGDEDLWVEAPEFSMTKLEDGSAVPNDFADKWCTFKMLYNEDALYILVNCEDDSILAPANLDPWNRDCVELFIDEDNSKNDQATGYDANDHQWRYVVDAVYEEGVTAEPGPFAFNVGETNFTFEISLPQESIPDLVLEDGTEFGFDISSADTDNDKYRSMVAHWWATSGYAWNTPAVFGDAELLEGENAVEDVVAMPNKFELGNYPNPFNPTTTVEYTLDETSNVKLTVYDVLGNQVAVLDEGVRMANQQYSVQFDGSALTSGVYFYKLEAGTKVITNKMMLLK